MCHGPQEDGELEGTRIIRCLGSWIHCRLEGGGCISQILSPVAPIASLREGLDMFSLLVVLTQRCGGNVPQSGLPDESSIGRALAYLG